MDDDLPWHQHPGATHLGASATLALPAWFVPLFALGLFIAAKGAVRLGLPVFRVRWIGTVFPYA